MEIEAEIRKLRQLAKDASALVTVNADPRETEPIFKPDSKASAFLEFVDALFRKSRKEKLLVFTEYVDTLNYLLSLLQAMDGGHGHKYRLTKIHGSTNAVNVTRATIEALRSLRSAQELSERRGVPVRLHIPGQPAAEVANAR